METFSRFYDGAKAITYLIWGLAILAVSTPTFAADVPQSFTLDGQLFSDTTATSALQDSSIEFRIQVLDEAKVCVLYEETQSVSTLASKGYFSVQVGTELGSIKRSSGDSANSMATVFQNITAINGKLLSNGSPCNVAPVAGKRRFVRISIAPSTMGATARVLSPDLTIDSVPNSVVAERAESIQGLRANNLLQVNTAAGSALSQANLESLFTSTTRFNSLTSVIDGTSTNYMRSNSGSGAQLPVLPGTPTTPPIGAIWFDSTDSRIKFQTSVGPATLGTGGGSVTSVGFTAPTELTVTGAPITDAGTIAVTWAAQTTGRVFASPNGSTGTPTFRSLVAADVPFAIQNLGGTPSFQSGLDAAKGSATTAGRIWISTDTREIYRDTGTTWETIGSAGGGGAPSGAASGDLSGTYPGPTVSRIQGVGVSVTAPLDGQVLKYIGGGTAAWTPTNFNIGDLKTAAGTQQFAGSATCAASQTLTWSSLTDTFVCSNIAGLDGGVITAGTVPAARLPASASAWTVSGADLYRTGGNVGIGTATPSSALHVAGELTVADSNTSVKVGVSNTTSAFAAVAIGFNNQAGNNTNSIAVGNGNNSGAGGSSFGRYNVTTQSQAVAFGESNNSSAVGSAAFGVGNTASATGASAFGSGVTNSTANSAMFGASDTAKITVLSSGNVGIGTASPQSRLHIQNASGSSGSASFTTADFSPGVSGSSLNLSSGATSGNTYYQMQTMIAGAAAFGNLILQPNAGNVGVGTASPSTTLDINGGMTYRGLATGSAPATAASQGKIYFDSTLNKFRVSENNGAYTDLVGGGGGGAATSVNAGNGTASAPSISFSGDTDTGFFSNGADTIGVSTGNSNIFNFSSAGLVSTTTGGGLVTSANGTAAAPAFSFAGDTGTGWFRAAASTLAASTGGAERLRIDATGNVGIGTTTPGALLTVNSAAALSANGQEVLRLSALNGSTVGSGAALKFTDQYANGVGEIRSFWEAPAETGLAFFTNGASTPQIFLRSNGNVGIGTTAPSNSLEVRSDAPSDLGLIKLSNRSTANWGVGSKIQFHGESDLKLAELSSNWWGTTGANSTVELRTRRNGSIYNAIKIVPEGPADVPGVNIGDWNLGSPALGARFTINSSTSTGNTVIPGLTLSHFDSDGGGAGGSSNGIGNRLNFQSETTVNGSNAESGYVESGLDDATDTSKDGSLRFGTLGPDAGAGSNLATEKMRIDSNGNVGIGTTNPTSTLDVVGGTAAASTAGRNISFTAQNGGTGNANGGNVVVLGGAGAGTGSQGSLLVGTSTVPYSSLPRHSIYAAGDLVTSGNIVATSALLFGDGTTGIYGFNSPNYLAFLTSGSETVRIDADGDLGIGVTNPTSKLQVAGDVTPDATASRNLGSTTLRWNNIYLSNSPNVSSDERLKKDVKASDLGLDFINSLRPVSWVWKDESQGATQHYGIIAQEAKRAIAEATGVDSENVIVSHDTSSDSYSVRYTELIAPLIKATQEIYAKLVGLDSALEKAETKIANLEAENAAKAEEIALLKTRLDKIEKALSAE